MYLQCMFLDLCPNIIHHKHNINQQVFLVMRLKNINKVFNHWRSQRGQLILAIRIHGNGNYMITILNSFKYPITMCIFLSTYFIHLKYYFLFLSETFLNGIFNVIYRKKRLKLTKSKIKMRSL